ncbi:MAG: NAD-dependent epimerase/dehydratase family protein [Pseudonocardiaceae bacterium]
MVAVVTGAAGFIGRTLVRLLAQRGEVVGIDRRPQRPVPGLTPITADLLDADPVVRRALVGASVVHHLAGWPDVRDERPDVEYRRFRDNVLATCAVLAAVPPDTPLVVTSSSSVYGGTHGGRPSRETDRLHPRGGYARSKVAVEQVCDGRLQVGGAVIVVRPFTVAGEGQRPGMALARWLAAARAGDPLTVLGSPARTRDITDVRQVAAALADLAGSGLRGTVNLGTGVGRSLADLADAVSRMVGVDVSTSVVPAQHVEVSHTLADTRLLRRTIGWVPSTDLDELVSRQLTADTGTAISESELEAAG